MSQEKETVINNINTNEVIEELHKNRAKILEDFAAAYLAETKTLPSEVELVCQESKKDNIIETTYHFRRKVNGKNKGTSNESENTKD